MIIKKKKKVIYIVIIAMILIAIVIYFAIHNPRTVEKFFQGDKNNFEVSGTFGGCNWKVENNQLTLSGGLMSNVSDSVHTPWHNYASQIVGVYVNSGVKTNTNAVGVFGDLYNCTWISMKNLDTSQTVYLSHFFDGCKKLTSLTLPDNFVTTKVVATDHMFADCQSIQTLDVSKFAMSNVTSIKNMFYCCYKLQTISWGTFNTSKVTDFSNLFHSDYSLTSVKVLSTPKATNMENMFYGCSSLTSINLSNYTTTNVTNMKQMFFGCASLISLNLSTFNTAKVTNMERMFCKCTSLTSIDLSTFNTSQVTNNVQMLYRLDNCNKIILGSNYRFKHPNIGLVYGDVPMDSTGNEYISFYYWRKSGQTTIQSSKQIEDLSSPTGTWIRVYYINYYQGNTKIADSYIDCGSSGTLKAYSSTPPANWAFYGWSNTSTGTTKNYNNSATISNAPVSKTILNLYAIFSRTITIEYNGNGSTGGSTANTTKSVLYNPNDSSTSSQAMNLSANGFSRTGYSFVGWNTNSAGTGTTYAAGASYNPGLAPSHSTFKVTLYAIWNAVNYPITYDLDGGTASPANPTSYTIATETFTLTNPTKDGYTFVGWTGSNGTTPELSVTIASGSTGSKSYTANWRQNKVVINIQRNGLEWSNSGMKVALYQNGVKKYSTIVTSGTMAEFEFVEPGVYDIYAGKNSNEKETLVDTGKNITVGDINSPY